VLSNFTVQRVLSPKKHRTNLLEQRNEYREQHLHTTQKDQPGRTQSPNPPAASIIFSVEDWWCATPREGRTGLGGLGGSDQQNLVSQAAVLVTKQEPIHSSGIW
jgi:hypothetical protein